MAGRHDDWGFGADWAAWSRGPWSWGFGPRRGARPGGRGRAKGRVFDRGDLKFAVLRLLDRKPMHGYEVMQALEDESGGWYTASPGSVYPVLQMLQDQGHVTSDDEDGKRVYRITPAGRTFLRENSDRVEDVMDRVSDFASRFSGEGMGDVTRAFVRLAQTSFEEAVRRSGDEKALTRIQTILETATKEVKAMRTEGPGAD